MAYEEFTLEKVESDLGITQRPGPAFSDLDEPELPPWLPGQLALGMRMAPMSEKARSEFIIAPMLLAVRELSGDEVSILSGYRLDIDPDRKLSGECDFLLSRSEPLPRLRAALLAVLEAKRGDIEVGLGRCAAQMVGIQLFNDRAGPPSRPVYGCVTTGDDWPFLRLEGRELIIDPKRRYIHRPAAVLAGLVAAVGANSR